MSRIFISLASYRDEYLPFTIESALSKARHPENLRFGICWQARPEENLDKYLADERIRILKYADHESLGYGWARAEVQKLYDGEEYHLLIDSHSYLAPDWDVNLIRQLQTKPSEKPLLTTSSPPFTFDESGKVVIPWVGTDLDGVPRMTVQQHPPVWLDIQMSPERAQGVNERTYLLCANFLFTHGRWIVDVPEDPQMVNACHESALAARSYTHGYDSFLPDEIQVWHLDYRNYRQGRRKVWEVKSVRWQDEQTQVMIQRLHALLFQNGDPSILGPYGLGEERSVEEWAANLGLDLDRRRSEPI